MRRLLSMVLCILCASMTFANTWENNVVASTGTPMSIIKLDRDGDDKVNSLGLTFDINYVGIHSSGFSVKAALGLGVISSDDIAIDIGAIPYASNYYYGDYPYTDNAGIYCYYSLGVGYTLVRGDKLTLGIFGIVGNDIMGYSSEEKMLASYDVPYKIDVEQNILVSAVYLGIDASAFYHLTSKLALYANVSSRFIVGGQVETEISDFYYYRGATWDVNDTSDIKHGFEISPTVGIAWTF